MKLYHEQFRDHKQELTNILMLSFFRYVAKTDDLVTQHTQLGKALFNYILFDLIEPHTPVAVRVVTSTDKLEKSDYRDWSITGRSSKMTRLTHYISMRSIPTHSVTPFWAISEGQDNVTGSPESIGTKLFHKTFWKGH